MKNKLSKLASVVLTFFMLLVLIPTMEVNADQAELKVHFKNTEGWGSVYAYTWEGNDLGSWPGMDITSSKDGDYYTVTMVEPVGPTVNIIFGAGDGQPQTVDLKLDLTKGMEFWVVPKETNNEGKWMCVVDTSKSAAEGGNVEKFEPKYPSNPTIKKSPVIKGNKVTFYFECTNADTVAVAGDMNDWSTSDWIMKKDGNVYSYTCELPAKTYAYKFVVNGEWYADPLNPETADDGFGGVNSVFTVKESGSTKPAPTIKSPVIEGGKVTFNYKDANAGKVELMCSAYDWQAIEMDKKDDVFTCTVVLPNGEYEYKFLVDGGRWLTDPSNANTNDAGNSVFKVTNGVDAPVEPEYTPTITESVVIDGNTVTLYYESPTASNVELFGSMNNWEEAYPMNKEGNVFSVTLELNKGDYQYKFVVDGNWINDPLNGNVDEKGDNVFSVISELPVIEDTENNETGTTDTEMDGVDTENQESTENDLENPDADVNPIPGGVIILIAVIVIALGCFAVYLFLKKKNA